MFYFSKVSPILWANIRPKIKFKFLILEIKNFEISLPCLIPTQRAPQTYHNKMGKRPLTDYTNSRVNRVLSSRTNTTSSNINDFMEAAL